MAWHGMAWHGIVYYRIVCCALHMRTRVLPDKIEVVVAGVVIAKLRFSHTFEKT